MTEQKKRMKWGEWLRKPKHLALLTLLSSVALLVWLNETGLRWLGPKVVAQFLAKEGMTGNLKLGGTLLGGIEVYELEIRSPKGQLECLKVDKLVTNYRLLELLSGKVREISGSGIHVDLRIIKTQKEEKKLPDFKALAKALGTARQKFIPLALELSDMSVSAKKDGERIVEIIGASVAHKPGADLIELALGTVTDASGRTLRPQKVAMVWEERKLTLGKFDLLPFVGVRNMELMLPEDGTFTANGEIRVRDAIFKMDVGEGISDVRVDLTEGALDFGNPLAGFGVGIPLKGRMTSLAMEVRNLFPDWTKAVGTAEVFIEGFSYDGWKVPEASIGVKIGDEEISAKLAAKSLGSDFTIDAKGAFDRSSTEQGKIGLERIAGNFHLAQAGNMLRALDAKLKLPNDFKKFPASEITGKWAMDLREMKISGATVDLTLSAKEADASPIRLDAAFAEGVVSVKRLAVDGMEFSGKYTLKTQAYEAQQIPSR